MLWQHSVHVETDTTELKKFNSTKFDLSELINKVKSDMQTAKKRMLTDIGKTSQGYQVNQIFRNNSVHSGALFKSIHQQFIGDTVNIGSNKEYIYYLEEGRGEVYPVSSPDGLLHYQTKDGRWIVTNKSKSAPARPYLYDSSKQLKSRLNHLPITKYLKF